MLGCGKFLSVGGDFVAQQVVELLWARPLVVSVAGVLVVSLALCFTADVDSDRSSLAPCPLHEAYHFSYINNSGGACVYPASYVKPCASPSRLRFYFRECSSAAYTHEHGNETLLLIVNDSDIGSTHWINIYKYLLSINCWKSQWRNFDNLLMTLTSYIWNLITFDPRGCDKKSVAYFSGPPTL